MESHEARKIAELEHEVGRLRMQLDEAETTFAETKIQMSVQLLHAVNRANQYREMIDATGRGAASKEKESWKSRTLIAELSGRKRDKVTSQSEHAARATSTSIKMPSSSSLSSESVKSSPQASKLELFDELDRLQNEVRTLKKEKVQHLQVLYEQVAHLISSCAKLADDLSLVGHDGKESHRDVDTADSGANHQIAKLLATKQLLVEAFKAVKDMHVQFSTSTFSGSTQQQLIRIRELEAEVKSLRRANEALQLSESQGSNHVGRVEEDLAKQLVDANKQVHGLLKSNASLRQERDGMLKLTRFIKNRGKYTKLVQRLEEVTLQKEELAKEFANFRHQHEMANREASNLRENIASFEILWLRSQDRVKSLEKKVTTLKTQKDKIQSELDRLSAESMRQGVAKASILNLSGSSPSLHTSSSSSRIGGICSKCKMVADVLHRPLRNSSEFALSSQGRQVSPSTTGWRRRRTRRRSLPSGSLSQKNLPRVVTELSSRPKAISKAISTSSADSPDVPNDISFVAKTLFLSPGPRTPSNPFAKTVYSDVVLDADSISHSRNTASLSSPNKSELVKMQYPNNPVSPKSKSNKGVRVKASAVSSDLSQLVKKLGLNPSSPCADIATRSEQYLRFDARKTIPIIKEAVRAKTRPLKGGKYAIFVKNGKF